MQKSCALAHALGEGSVEGVLGLRVDNCRGHEGNISEVRAASGTEMCARTQRSRVNFVYISEE
jgi:hypothetical protein